MMTKKNTKQFIACLCILSLGAVLLFFPDVGRAQGIASDSLIETQSEWVQVLNDIIGLASWLRIVPAKIAGLLMTNYFIYGTSFFLVDYLFMFWQVIRTFALYALGLYFVGYILYSWFNPQEAKSKIAELFKNTLIAGILISMSWRLVAAAVDLSVVFTSAVASIPSHIYEQERSKRQQCFSVPKNIRIKENYLPDTDLMGDPNNYYAPGRDKIKPDGTDISGPLMFFGASVLKFFDMVYLPEQDIQGAGSADGEEQRDVSKTLIVIGVKAMLLILLIIPMIILMVVNMIRVVYLWLRIIFAPLIVLVNIFGIKISDSLEKYLSWKNILGLIMQPVAVIGMMSIGFIFIIELASVMNMCVPNPGDLPIAVKTIGDGIHAPIGEMINPAGSETTLGASLSAVGKTIGGISGQMIMSLFVIILMRALIKIGFSFSELTKEVATKITDSVESFAGTIPLIPLPGVGAIGMSAARNFAKRGFGLNNVIGKRMADQEQLLREKLGLDKGQIHRPDLLKLENMANQSTTSLDELQKEIKKQLEDKYITQKDAQSLVVKWLAGAGKSSPELQRLGLSALQTLKDDDLKELWTGKNKNNAYRLLNRLFGKGGSTTPANNISENQDQYGPYKTSS